MRAAPQRPRATQLTSDSTPSPVVIAINDEGPQNLVLAQIMDTPAFLNIPFLEPDMVSTRSKDKGSNEIKGGVWIIFLITQFSSLITHYLSLNFSHLFGIITQFSSLNFHHSIFFTLFVGPYLSVGAVFFCFCFCFQQPNSSKLKKKKKRKKKR